MSSLWWLSSFRLSFQANENKEQKKMLFNLDDFSCFFCNNFFLFHSFTQQLIRCCRLATSWSMASVRNSYIWIEGNKTFKSKRKKQPNLVSSLMMKMIFCFSGHFVSLTLLYFLVVVHIIQIIYAAKTQKMLNAKWAIREKNHQQQSILLAYIIFCFVFFCVKIDKW